MFASKFVAKVTTSMFGVNTLACTLFEQPARNAISPSAAYDQWRAGFLKAAFSQVGLNLVAIGSLATVYYLEPNSKLIPVIALLSTILPYTSIFMMPTNNRLLDNKNEPTESEKRHLVAKWGNLHAVRSVIGMTAMLILLYNY